MNRGFERHRSIIDFSISSLIRRKGKNLSLLAVYTLVVFVIASTIFFVQALKREAALLLGESPDIVVQRLVAGRHDLIPIGYVEKIAAIRGVSDVKPRLWGYYYDAAVGANYTVMAADSDPPPAGGVRLGNGVASTRRLSDGDVLTMRGADGTPALFTVEKVLPEASELVAADLVMMTAEDFRTLFAFPDGRATDLVLSVSNPRETTTVAAKIVRLFPDTRPILKSEILRTYDSVFDWRGGMLVVILSVALLSFIIFAWDKATGLSAEERKEIGILKSIGWETADVLMLKFWEGTVISLSAFLVGTILAYLHVFFFSASLFEQALKGWAVLYPRFRLIPVIDPYQLAVLFFLTVVPYAVATIIPSWRAATVDPDAVMRS
ncbi:MAG TPA: FtsX-like permease family protein [Geobacteraceae bacterium]|nr:FtsX-like permease family protein [Geobacteraceae bacterium]